MDMISDRLLTVAEAAELLVPVSDSLGGSSRTGGSASCGSAVLCVSPRPHCASSSQPVSSSR
jgi:hypothetical protein